MKKETSHILLKNKKLHLSFLILYISVVFLLSLVKFGGGGTPLFFEGFDKVVHVLFYFGMTVLSASFVDRCFNGRRTSLLLAFFGSVAIGGFIEGIQPYFDRTCDLNDFMFNSTGALIGVVVYIWVRRKAKQFFSKEGK